MRSRRSDLRLRWLLVAIAVLFVATASISVAAVAVQGSNNADAAADEIMDRIGTRTADLIVGQLEPPTVSMTQIALSMESLAGTTEASREHMLASQLESMPTLSGAFIATPDGSFEFVRREGPDLIVKRITVGDDGTRTVVEGPLDEDLRPQDLTQIDDDFDPLVRPWYQEAVAEPGSTAWTDPYVFFSSQEPGVTAARAVTDDAGAIEVVVGLDITLTALRESVEDLPIDAEAEAFLVADGFVIAAPSNQSIVTSESDGELALVSAGALGLEESDAGRIDTAELEREGMPDWSIVVRADSIGFIDTVERQTRLVIAAVVLSVLVGFALLVALGQRLRRPIDELVTLADRDPLTDLANRRAVLAFGDSALRDAAARNAEVTVAVVDIDLFKEVNDEHGHAAGDEALRRLGAGLRQFVRPTDLVGRYGGDEFVVILTDTDIDKALPALARIKGAAEDELQATPETADCTLTLGIASRRGRAVDIDTLIAEADTELLDAKRSRDDQDQDSASAAESQPS